MPEVMYAYFWQPSFFCRLFDFFLQGGFCEIKDAVILSNPSKFGNIFINIIIKKIRDGDIPIAFFCFGNQDQFHSFYFGIVFVYGNTFIWQYVGRCERQMDLCQYFGQKKSKDYAVFLSSSSSFCCGVK